MPTSLDEARRLVQGFVECYDDHRLHNAIGFVTPADMLAGRAEAIWAARDEKLEQARERRRVLQRESSGKISTGQQLLLTDVHCTTTHESHYR